MSYQSLLFLSVCIYFTSCNSHENSNANWSHYLGDPQRSHFTTLDQISPQNVDDLEIAWIYNAPDTGQMQMNPIIIDKTLYGVTASLKAFALDASTGEQKWIFNENEKVWSGVSRGLSYWEEGEDKRILYTLGSELLALNAETGKLIETFGLKGRLDLHLGLPEVAQKKHIISNTPGAIYKDLIVLPFRLSEGADAAPGDIRAFNIKDGSLAWTFHVIPYPGEKGYETWENKEAYKNENGVGAGNNWAGMTVDVTEGVIYVPTGSFAPDFYGGHRPGINLYSNCLLALNASTGELLWHQQLTHHDIWDRDIPAPPNLLTIHKNEEKIDAIAQISKQGYVYVFNKRTGEPIYEIEEVPVPRSMIEKAWPTQPIPVKPAAFARRSDEITAEDYSPYAPNQKEIIDLLKNTNKAFYSPPDTLPTLLLPGYDGGAEWGGAGVDPENGIIYINSNEMAWILALKKTPNVPKKGIGRGEFFYTNNCSVCHMSDLKGSAASGYPSLGDIKDRMSRAEVLSIVNHGKGMMTGFSGFDKDDKEAVIDYIFGLKDEKISEKESINAQYKIPYSHTGYTKFLDANGLPAISPPWGTLNAIDLNSGEYLWKIPFGEIDSLVDLGYPITGTESYGGPVITENGLLIIAATKDSKVRIFNRHTGDLLWQDKLPASSFATPSTYEVDGKQYIVLACGGEKLGTTPGNKLVAYTLKN